jgi:7-cyano-7-deazaguanine reductase
MASFKHGEHVKQRRHHRGAAPFRGMCSEPVDHVHSRADGPERILEPVNAASPGAVAIGPLPPSGYPAVEEIGVRLRAPVIKFQESVNRAHGKPGAAGSLAFAGPGEVDANLHSGRLVGDAWMCQAPGVPCFLSFLIASDATTMHRMSAKRKENGPAQKQAGKSRARRAGLTLLGGGRNSQPGSPNDAKLEAFGNTHPGRKYWVELDCPEFTSVCPITGQPDFGHLTIRYVPGRLCLESKSLKLYLFAFRGEGAFHEEVVNRILDDIVSAIRPRRAQVAGVFNARGGISIRVEAAYP